MSEIDDRAKVLARLGVWDRDELLEAVAEEFELDEFDGVPVDRALSELAIEAADWPAVTDWDRLDRAFDALGEQGVIALHLAGYTQSDGYADVREVYEAAPDGVIGYCFYHQQDAERALAGGGLYLAFGPMDPAKEDTEGPAIGRRIVAALDAQGLRVTWDGTFNERLWVTPFVWRRRP